MKLQRESLNLGSEYNGKWQFCIYDKDPEALERVERMLCNTETGAVFASGKVETWKDFCDLCPCYEDGFSSGFWIDVDLVDDFKAAWKKVKKSLK